MKFLYHSVSCVLINSLAINYITHLKNETTTTTKNKMLGIYGKKILKQNHEAEKILLTFNVSKNILTILLLLLLLLFHNNFICIALKFLYICWNVFLSFLFLVLLESWWFFFFDSLLSLSSLFFFWSDTRDLWFLTTHTWKWSTSINGRLHIKQQQKKLHVIECMCVTTGKKIVCQFPLSTKFSFSTTTTTKSSTFFFIVVILVCCLCCCCCYCWFTRR